MRERFFLGGKGEGGRGSSTARVGDLLYVVLTVPLVGGWLVMGVFQSKKLVRSGF